MKGGRLPLESNVSPEGDGTQLGNDIINLVFSSINAITDTITTVVDVVDLSSNMGSEFSSLFHQERKIYKLKYIYRNIYVIGT